VPGRGPFRSRRAPAFLTRDGWSGFKEGDLMSDELIEITGIDEVCRALTAAPRAAVPGALLKGLKASGQVLQDAIAARVPVKVGELKADLGMTITLDSDFRGGVVEVGFSGQQGHVARFVEMGHKMIGHKPDKKDLGEVDAHPFMRPAADMVAEAAIDAFVDGVMEELAQARIVEAA